MWVVNPARGGQKELSAATAERAWQEAAAAARQAAAAGGGDASQAGDQGLPPPPHFEVAYVKSSEAALRQIQKELGRIKWALPHPAAAAPTCL